MATATEDPYPAEPPLATWDLEAPADPPEQDRAAPGRRGAPLPVAAAVAALWAGVLGFVPLLGLSLAVAVGNGAAPVAVARVAAGAWLLGHGVPVMTAADRITLVPLGVTAWVCWRLARAGVHAGRATGALRGRSIWPVMRAGLAVAIMYGLLGAVVAVLAATAQLSISPWR